MDARADRLLSPGLLLIATPGNACVLVGGRSSRASRQQHEMQQSQEPAAAAAEQR